MPRVIPSGGEQDKTALILLEAAKNNEALARLFISLMARREESMRREALVERRRQQANDEWYKRFDYRYDRMYGPQTQDGGTQQHPFGSTGAAGSGTPPPTTKPAATTTQAPVKPPIGMIPGATPLGPGQDTFTPRGQSPTQASPAASNTVPTTPGYDSFAQAGAGDIEVSAQSRTQPQPQVQPATEDATPNTIRGRGYTRAPRDLTQLPTQPRVNPRRPPARADFLPMGGQWLDEMAAAEKKYNIPQGTLLALYGFENSGGRFLGRNGKASGLFQFTDRLRGEYKLSDQDVLNPSLMIDRAAFNMRRNANALEKNYGIKLEPTPENMPLFTIMHQFGVVDGPMIVAHHIKSPKTPITQAMAQIKDRNNYDVLVGNKIEPTWSASQVVEHHAGKIRPWYHGGINIRTQHKEGTLPQAGTQTQGQPPRPPGDIKGASLAGVNPRLVAAVQGGAQFLPAGYTIRATSGHRPGGDPRSHHHKGNAADFAIIDPNGREIPNKGADTTGMYTRLARGVKTWVLENDPQLMTRIGYGGAFGTQLGGGGVPDLMHFDLGGSRGNMVPNVQFARLQPLSAQERQQTAVAASRTVTPPSSAPATAATTATPTTEASAQQRRPIKPSEQYNPLMPPVPGVPDPSKQFGARAQPSIAAMSTADLFRAQPDAYTPTQVAQRTQSVRPKTAQPQLQLSDVPLPPTRPQVEVPLPPQRPQADIPLPRERPQQQVQLPLPLPRPGGLDEEEQPSEVQLPFEEQPAAPMRDVDVAEQPSEVQLPFEEQPSELPNLDVLEQPGRIPVTDEDLVAGRFMTPTTQIPPKNDWTYPEQPLAPPVGQQVVSQDYSDPLIDFQSEANRRQAAIMDAGKEYPFHSYTQYTPPPRSSLEAFMQPSGPTRNAASAIAATHPFNIQPPQDQPTVEQPQQKRASVDDIVSAIYGSNITPSQARRRLAISQGAGTPDVLAEAARVLKEGATRQIAKIPGVLEEAIRKHQRYREEERNRPIVPKKVKTQPTGSDFQIKGGAPPTTATKPQAAPVETMPDGSPLIPPAQPLKIIPQKKKAGWQNTLEQDVGKKGASVPDIDKAAKAGGGAGTGKIRAVPNPAAATDPNAPKFIFRADNPPPVEQVQPDDDDE